MSVAVPVAARARSARCHVLVFWCCWWYYYALSSFATAQFCNSETSDILNDMQSLRPVVDIVCLNTTNTTMATMGTSYSKNDCIVSDFAVLGNSTFATVCVQEHKGKLEVRDIHAYCDQETFHIINYPYCISRECTDANGTTNSRYNDAIEFALKTVEFPAVKKLLESDSSLGVTTNCVVTLQEQQGYWQQRREAVIWLGVGAVGLLCLCLVCQVCCRTKPSADDDFRQ